MANVADNTMVDRLKSIQENDIVKQDHRAVKRATRPMLVTTPFSRQIVLPRRKAMVTRRECRRKLSPDGSTNIPDHVFRRLLTGRGPLSLLKATMSQKSSLPQSKICLRDAEPGQMNDGACDGLKDVEQDDTE